MALAMRMDTEVSKYELRMAVLNRKALATRRLSNKTITTRETLQWVVQGSIQAD